jgi:hypothetical protein
VSGPQNPNEKNPELKIYLSHHKKPDTDSKVQGTRTC